MFKKMRGIGPAMFRKNVNFSAKEIVGQRANQEDYSLFRLLNGSTALLAVLSDGMGGHSSGEVASRTAVDSFDRTFNEYPSDSTPVKLGAALQQANSELAKAIRLKNDLDGMGCTLVGAYIDKNGLQWISVGDSPLFLFRGGKLSRLNADHSMAPLISESLSQGKITKDEAQNHPNRHALRSAVMGGELPLIDAPISPIALFKGDVVILASDGLLTLSMKEIEQIISRNLGGGAETVAQRLLSAVEAKNHPRQDNTSVQVIAMPSSMIQSRFGFRKAILYLTSLVLFAFSGFATYYWIANDEGAINRLFSSSDMNAPKPIKLPESDGLIQPQPQGLDGLKPSAQEDADKSPAVKPPPEKAKVIESPAQKSKKTPSVANKKPANEAAVNPSPDTDSTPKSIPQSDSGEAKPQ